MVEYLISTLIGTPGLFNVPSLSDFLTNQLSRHWATLVLLQNIRVARGTSISSLLLHPPLLLGSGLRELSSTMVNRVAVQV